jgi:exodeoxyribonuclease VII small subunit
MSELETLSFEQAFTELEELVRQLEAGDLSLDQTLALYERGMALAAHCNAKLDMAELRIRQLAPGLEPTALGDVPEPDTFEQDTEPDTPF